MRFGAIRTKVYEKRGRFGRLGHRAKALALPVADSVRVQNRINVLLQSRGVARGITASIPSPRGPRRQHERMHA